MKSCIAEVSLKYKRKPSADGMPRITSPEAAVGLLRSIWNKDTLQLKEEFVVILLSNAKRCLGWSLISSGSSTATIVDPAAVFQVAILGNAQSIILAHNHPSGQLRASGADINLTNRIKKAGDMLCIKVEDHIILTSDGYMSFQERGLM